MRDIQGVGLFADVIEAPSPQDPNATVKFGIRSETFQRHSRRGLATAIAQYYGVVQGGMILAQHVFQGLRRPLMLADDMQADRSVFVYTWRSSIDYEWLGTPQYGHPEPMSPPPGRVFVVLVRAEQPDDLGVLGSIEKWNWVREDQTLPGAPVDWQQRYDNKIWSL